MTTKIISTYIAAGYSLATNYAALTIAAGGGIGGFGLQLHALTRVVNDGFVSASGGSNGVTAYAAATLINGSADDQSVGIRGYSGIFAPNAAVTVSNFGSISGRGTYGNGVFLVKGGAVTNGSAADTGATIYGVQSSVVAALTARVSNFGTLMGQLSDGVLLSSGGSVTNGSVGDFRALIEGANGVVSNGGALTVVNFRTIQGRGSAGVELITAGKVSNFGTIAGKAQDGVYMLRGGSLTNGSATDGRASIKGAAGGVFAEVGSLNVSNFGSIAATDSGFGVYISSGLITNGSTLATGALIVGVYGGVEALTASATVTNFGTIDGAGGTISSGIAVSLKAGGTVTNGSAADTIALIEGAGFGVTAQAGVAKIANFGTISAFHAVYLFGGGSVTNGSATDTTAAIIGEDGVSTRSGPGTVINFGSIIGYGDEWAVSLSQGSVTNGSATDTGALMDGGKLGVLVAGGGTVTNFGTIVADLSSPGASGVYVDSGSITNGSATDSVATITGRYGVFGGSAGAITLTNFGTVHGFGGTAVYFGNSADVLNVEAGSAFIGAVTGDGGVLNLATGTGTLSGITGTGTVTVSGSMAATTFQNFNLLEIGAGARFTDGGAVTVAAGQTIINSGTLTLAGAVSNSGTLEAAAGTLTVQGAVTGAGRVVITKGTADFNAAFSQSVIFAAGATGVLELAQSTAYTGTVSGFSKTGATALDLADIAFASGTTTASFSGTTTAGTLTVTDGTHTAKIRLAGNYTASTWTVSSDGHGGTTVVDPAGPPPRVAPLLAAMAALGPSGAATHARGPGGAIPAHLMLAMAHHTMWA
jgi:hypothetical protein